MTAQSIKILRIASRRKEVEGEGNPASAKSSGSVEDARVDGCILGEVASWCI